jgi:hypothetical protein
MRKDLNCVVEITHYLTECRADSHKKQLVRDYLKHKIGKLMYHRKNRPSKNLIIFGIPINLFSF